MVLLQRISRNAYSHSRRFSIATVQLKRNSFRQSSYSFVSTSKPAGIISSIQLNHELKIQKTELSHFNRFSSTWNWTTTKLNPEDPLKTEESTASDISPDTKAQKEILDSCADLYRSIMPLNDKVCLNECR